MGNEAIEVWQDNNSEITSFKNDEQYEVNEKSRPFERVDDVFEIKQRRHVEQDENCRNGKDRNNVCIKDKQNNNIKKPFYYVLDVSEDDTLQMIHRCPSYNDFQLKQSKKELSALQIDPLRKRGEKQSNNNQGTQRRQCKAEHAVYMRDAEIQSERGKPCLRDAFCSKLRSI